MNSDQEVALAAAHANADAVGAVAVMGLAAICNELARLGALDAAAVDRVAEFMITAAEGSGGTEKLRSHLRHVIQEQFGDLADRLAAGLGATGSPQ